MALGNPGQKYALTRHNAGWIVLDEVYPHLDWCVNKYAHARIAIEKFGDARAIFVKPETFMNESGRVLPHLIQEYGIQEGRIIVLQDEIDLLIGTIRISYARGTGGHNGIKSIVSVLGSNQFVRIRIGVSILDNNEVLRKPDVLGNFSKEELVIMRDEVSRRTKKALTMILDGRKFEHGKNYLE